MSIVIGVFLGVVQALLLSAMGILPLLALPLCLLLVMVTLPAYLPFPRRSPAFGAQAGVVCALAVLLQSAALILIGGAFHRAVDTAAAAWGLGTILSVAWRVTLFWVFMLATTRIRDEAREEATVHNWVTLCSLGWSIWIVLVAYIVMGIWPAFNPTRLLW